MEAIVTFLKMLCTLKDCYQNFVQLSLVRGCQLTASSPAARHLESQPLGSSAFPTDENIDLFRRLNCWPVFTCDPKQRPWC